MLNKKAFSALLVCASLLSPAIRADNDTHAASGDQQIAALVAIKLVSADPGVARMITVNVQEGVVTLSGRVYSSSQLAKVIQDVHSVAGVVRVKNHLSLP